MSPIELLASSFTCDGHADTFRNVALNGSDFVGGLGNNHLSLDRLQQATQNLQIMAVYVPAEESGHQATVSALRILLEAHRAVERAPQRLGLVLGREDLAACARSSHPWVLLSLEGADPVAGDLHLLEVFYRLGLRALGLTHNHNSCAGGGCAPPDGVRMGLTPFGRELLAEMQRLGILVDTAHLSRQAFDEVLETWRGPVVNSHSCCDQFVNLERNLTDDQLRALAASGGLAAVTFVPRFLRTDCDVVPPTSLDVFRHLEHMVEVAGIDHVGLGSDFDGVEHLPTDLREPRDLVHMVGHMQAAGWSEADIRQVIGGNWLRVLEQILR